MSSWQLEISHEAEKMLKRQDRNLRLRLRSVIDKLAVNPFPGPGRGVSPIKGKANVWRMRVGGWRILYVIDGQGELFTSPRSIPVEKPIGSYRRGK